jgi:hypothetical protein
MNRLDQLRRLPRHPEELTQPPPAKHDISPARDEQKRRLQARMEEQDFFHINFSPATKAHRAAQ